MLQVGRLHVQDPSKQKNFVNLPNPSSSTMALGFTQPLTEMSTRSRKIMFLSKAVRSISRYSSLAD
jgi:hypothetical protein